MNSYKLEELFAYFEENIEKNERSFQKDEFIKLTKLGSGSHQRRKTLCNKNSKRQTGLLNSKRIKQLSKCLLSINTQILWNY